jgi:hypothetical protein
MRELLFAAVGAVGNSSRSQKVVATTLGCALLGVAPLRVRHGKTSSWAARTNVIAEP